MREGGRKGQRNVYNIVIRGEGSKTKLWLVELLKLAELYKLTMEGYALLDDVGWELDRVVLCDECT